ASCAKSKCRVDAHRRAARQSAKSECGELFLLVFRRICSIRPARCAPVRTGAQRQGRNRERRFPPRIPHLRGRNSLTTKEPGSGRFRKFPEISDSGQSSQLRRAVETGPRSTSHGGSDRFPKFPGISHGGGSSQWRALIETTP